jgi:hypothetical protein
VIAMMTLVELFEAGYDVTVGSMFGDVHVDSLEEAMDYEGTCSLEQIDHDEHTAYFYELDDETYDE